MQVCDFCGKSEKAQKQKVIFSDEMVEQSASDVRRFRLELKDHDDPRDQIAWWVLDLCFTCRKQFEKTLDNLVQPEVEGLPPTIKKPSDFNFKRVEEEIKVKTPKK